MADNFSFPQDFAERILSNMPSEEICIKAVKEDGHNLKYISEKFRTEKVLKAAISENGYAITYITNPSENLQLLAVKYSGLVIGEIENPSDNVILKAAQTVLKNPCELCYAGCYFFEKHKCCYEKQYESILKIIRTIKLKKLLNDFR